MIDSFQRFVETFCPNACVPVDLVKIARNVLISNVRPRVEHNFRFHPPEIIPTPFCLVMDGECCLDRLYGGYFGDWVCGGQWNRMVDFLRTFFQVASKKNIEITVIFNGALEPHRMKNWIEKQKSEKEKISQVLRHCSCKGTPPPKVWWIAPSCLRTCLRILLRHLNINVVLTTTDHHREVMSYIREYNYHGLLADDPDYIVLDPPRYFSAVNLKLTFKGCLETKEYILSEVTRCLNLHPSRTCIVAALIGNHILCDEDLTTFHLSLCSDTRGKASPNVIIKAIIDYVRNLKSVDDLDEVASQIFGADNEEKRAKFKQCVKYYSKENQNDHPYLSNVNGLLPIDNLYSLNAQNCTNDEKNTDLQNNKNCKTSLLSTPEYPSTSKKDPVCLRENSCQDYEISRLEAAVNVLALKHSKSNDKTKKILKSFEVPSLPHVSSEVMQMALDRHQNGLMHPYIYQILSKGEMKIPVLFEDDDSVREFPSPTVFYRPLRQAVYAILFNHHHLSFLSEQKKEKEGIEEKVPDIVVKEWTWSKQNKFNQPELVPAQSLGWAVPTIWRLWFGNGPEENGKRMRAFLTCMRCNDSSSICDPAYVPQHLIILCCVLRYIMASSEKPFLYKHELDAFLVQAMDPHLVDAEFTQKLEVPFITSRGVKLSALFMHGVDMALMANDACGAPVSWMTCCPWLFFDGKIFHCKLLKANTAKNLMDLCDNRYEEVSAVEHMRNAILEGLAVKFLTPHPSLPNYPLSAQPPLPQGRGRGHQRVVSRGGKLEVAGVVVGSWGPNFGQGPKSPSRNVPPQVVSVGGMGRGRPVPNTANRRGFPSPKRSPPQARAASPSQFSGTQLLGIGRGVSVLDNSPLDF